MTTSVVAGLRAAGIDVLTTLEAGRLNADDEPQLSFAASIGRAIYTANRGDFSRLHWQWQAAGRTHSGIIVRGKQRRPPQTRLRLLLELWQEYADQGLTNQIRYL